MTHLNQLNPVNRAATRILTTIFIAGLSLIGLLSIVPPIRLLQASPTSDALVRIDPVMVTTTTTAVSVPIDIVIENATGLYGADVRLTFDPTLLAVQDANPSQAGIQIELGPLLTSGTYFVIINSADNVSGTARLAITQLNPTLPVTGSGVLARIVFTPTGAVGVSALHLTQVQLASQTGNPITATTQDGIIEIQPLAVDFSRSVKLASAEIVSPTSQLTYTIVLTNLGSSIASGVTLTDAIPISTTYVPGSLTGSGAIYNLNENRIEWSGFVSPTGSITLSYAITVNATGFTTIVNNAYVSVDGVLDRVLTVATQVTPAGLPPKHVYLPLTLTN